MYSAICSQAQAIQLVLQGNDVQAEALCPTKLFANLDAEPTSCANDHCLSARLGSTGKLATASMHVPLIVATARVPLIVATACEYMGACCGSAQWPCDMISCRRYPGQLLLQHMSCI